MMKMILEYTAMTGMNVVVEGIETQSMEDRAKEYNATYGQGFYYSKPVKSDKILKWKFKNSNHSNPGWELYKKYKGTIRR